MEEGSALRTEAALVCVEASREAVYIARSVYASSAPGDGGEANKSGCLLAFSRQERRCSQV